MYENKFTCWIVWKFYKNSIGFRIAVQHSQDKHHKYMDNPTHPSSKIKGEE